MTDLGFKNQVFFIACSVIQCLIPRKKSNNRCLFQKLFFWELMNCHGFPSRKDTLSVSDWHPAHLCQWLKAYCWKKQPIDFSGFIEQCIILTSSVGRWTGTETPASIGKIHIFFNCQSWCLLLHPLPAARKWGRRVSLTHLSYLWAKPRSGHMAFAHIPHHQKLNTCNFFQTQVWEMSLVACTGAK